MFKGCEFLVVLVKIIVMVLRETVSFVFPRVLMFPEAKSRITKQTSFPRDHTLSALLYI